MPLLTSSAVKPPFYLFNGHLETIIPSLFRKVNQILQERERLELPDGDFLDIDWTFSQVKKSSDVKNPLVILTHGLEGDSRRHYIRGTVKLLSAQGFDALAWNCRSCSGEMNRLPRFYHHADYHDLSSVIEYAISKGYENISLIGFSMGGSQTFRYLGEMADKMPVQVKKGIGFSVPVDLLSSVYHMEKPQSQVYEQRFLKKLYKKIIEKSQLFPDIINPEYLSEIKHFRDFDNYYTAPLHGFRDADDFYERASVKPFLDKINIPTLLVNSRNDPFLTPECFPEEIAKKNDNLYMEFPEKGGHVGFTVAGDEFTWAEYRTLQWLKSEI
jgi:hypothetical protein